MKSVKERILKLSEAQTDWTQTEIAEKVGCSPSYVCAVLKEGRPLEKIDSGTREVVPRNTMTHIVIDAPITNLPIVVRVLHPNGSLKGTLYVSESGVLLRKPNQKVLGSPVSYELLEKLSS